jgi:hypothetical protein
MMSLTDPYNDPYEAGLSQWNRKNESGEKEMPYDRRLYEAMLKVHAALVSIDSSEGLTGAIESEGLHPDSALPKGALIHVNYLANKSVALQEMVKKWLDSYRAYFGLTL